jgi:hypothetical protein
VVVSEGEFTAPFTVQGLALGTTLLHAATAGGAVQSSTEVTSAPLGGFVINEVDYDQVSTDTAEFVELYNGTGADVALAGYRLFLVNGATDTSYTTIDLGPAGTLAAGQYLVVAATPVTTPPEALRISFALSSNNVQNGDPDGIALLDADNQLVDALSYEGAVTQAVLTGVPGTFSLVEGQALPGSVDDSNSVPGSLARLPSGGDTNDAATDWSFTGIPTPGASNQ